MVNPCNTYTCERLQKKIYIWCIFNTYTYDAQKNISLSKKSIREFVMKKKIELINK